MPLKFNPAPMPLEELRSRISYDPDTGVFRWTQNVGQKVRCKIAGTRLQSGYLQIRFGSGRKAVLAHRLAWYMHYGVWPDGLVDHRDLNRSNNRVSNLRLPCASQNSANCKPRAKSGLKGVYITRNGRFHAMVSWKGKAIGLGNYATAEEASLAYQRKAAELYGEYMRAS